MSKTYSLRLTDTALDDLAEIWLYLALEASEATATRFQSKLLKAAKVLERTPRIGAPRDVLAEGLRVIFHGAYSLYYQVDEPSKSVVIVRVLHGARDVSLIDFLEP